MISNSFAADSACQAISILEAWTRRDVRRLEQELNRTVDLCAVESDSTDEQERRELLGGVARAMRGSLPQVVLAGERPARFVVCVRLLEHLVRAKNEAPVF